VSSNITTLPLPFALALYIAMSASRINDSFVLSGTAKVCNACLSHAANKLFATLADAEAGRAHPNCRCVAVAGMSISQSQFDQLFVAGPVADRRTPSTGALLASPPATVSAPGISGLVPTVVTIGGVATIVWAAARRHQLGNDH
jgi:hypothetical protein